MESTQMMKLEVTNPFAAGIDVGSRSHFASVGQGTEDVQEFGVYSSDHDLLISWLFSHNITTVAMESTGNYWQNLFSALQEAGFEVLLANGKFTKNLKGRKSDVLDCQWIQKLHSLGLLSGSFLPDELTEQLRTYCRHRTNLVQMTSACSNKMQKYLRLMNLRLDVVVKDICGLTGMRIIQAVCQGESSPEKLAALRHGNCRKSEEEIAKALQSNGRSDYLFALQQEYQIYGQIQEKISQCDIEIKAFLDQYLAVLPEPSTEKIVLKKAKKVNKNTPKNIDLNQVSFRYFGGVDLMAIPGVSYATILTLMSEIGPDGFNKFPSAKHFASWLRLAPNNKVSGGKVLSRNTPKGSSRLKIGLRQAANVIGSLKSSPLYPFFIKIAVKKGRNAAITATARKLAVIIWNMVVNKEQYMPPNMEDIIQQNRNRKLKHVQKMIAKLDISPQELGWRSN